MNKRNTLLVPFLTLLGLLGISRVHAGSNFTHDFNQLFLIVTILSIIVAVVVMVMMSYFLYKYSGKSEEGAQNMSSTTTRKLEISWTLVATGIIVILMIASYPVLVNSIDNNAANIRDDYGNPTEIIVEGTQSWQWVFHTKDGIIKGNSTDPYPTLPLKVGKPYKLILWASGDWIHSFFVRGLGFKKDVVPGINNTISFVITDPGNYLVVCNQYCGPGHPQMRAYILAK